MKRNHNVTSWFVIFEQKYLLFVLACFIGIFILFSLRNNATIPFHDFDEANRAEAARNVFAYPYAWLSPVTGSPFFPSAIDPISAHNNPSLELRYFPQRPPLVFNIMAIGAQLFGDVEWVFRLQSTLFSIGTIAILVFTVAKFQSKINTPALVLAITTLITARDFWLMAQMAQLDAGLMFFLFLSFCMLFLYCFQATKKWYLIGSAVSLGLAILSKGQPAAVMAFPLITAFILRRITINELLLYVSITILTILPWIVAFIAVFGFNPLLSSFFNVLSIKNTIVQAESATSTSSWQATPIFWYIRWWLDTFRPGWVFFISLVASQIIFHMFSKKILFILSYIIGSFILYSVSDKKVW